MEKAKHVVIHAPDNGNEANNTGYSEIELQNARSKSYKKVKSFNVVGKDYNKFNEVDQQDDENQYFKPKDSANTSGPTQIFYVIDPESLQKGAVVDVKDKTANPGALGLLGFGLTTFLLNMHNAGVFPLSSMIVGMGIFYGGLV